MTAVARGKRQPETSISAGHMNSQWRIRCQVLEDQIADLTAALSASEAQRRELSADYKHALNALWKANGGMVRRDR